MSPFLRYFKFTSSEFFCSGERPRSCGCSVQANLPSVVGSIRAEKPAPPQGQDAAGLRQRAPPFRFPLQPLETKMLCYFKALSTSIEPLFYTKDLQVSPTRKICNQKII